MAVGTAASMYGQSRVESAQKKDIAATAEKYQQSRAQQQGFTAENEKTVADTLANYSKPTQDAASADAIANRQSAYTAPLQAKNFVADMPADFDPNNIIAGRNAYTGQKQQASSIANALAKAKLDAYGDVQTKNNIYANDNAAKIGMVKAISKNAADAAAGQQNILPLKLQADQNAGATWSGIGDVLKSAGMVYGMNPTGVNATLFGTPVPVGTSLSSVPMGDYTLGGVTRTLQPANLGYLNATPPSVYKGVVGSIFG